MGGGLQNRLQGPPSPELQWAAQNQVTPPTEVTRGQQHRCMQSGPPAPLRWAARMTQAGLDCHRGSVQLVDEKARRLAVVLDTFLGTPHEFRRLKELGHALFACKGAGEECWTQV